MPVKVGQSYVSEAAYEYAKNQTDEGATLKSLSEKFPKLKISVGTAPFSGNGLNNVAISPKILREMENNPDKKLEYEALLYDVANLNPPPSSMNIKAQGVIIDDNGEMSMWSIGESRSEKIPVKRSESKNWWAKLLEKLREKKSADVEISDEGLAALNADKEKVSGTVAFNAEKRARQLAAATSKSQVRAILNLLQTDLAQCEEGLKNQMCDAEEVEKVQKMIEQAEKRLSEVDDTEEKFSVDVLI